MSYLDKHPLSGALNRESDPFIEGLVIVPRIVPTSGSDISTIEHMLQGVSIKTERQRVLGVLPRLGSGRTDHKVERNAFGQPKEFKDDEIFEELDKFDPVRFINGQDLLIFPVILSNVSLKDPEQLDGAIEPFTIRTRASLTSIDHPFEAHDVRASIQDGNVDSFRRTDRIMQFIELPRATYIFPDRGIGLTGSQYPTDSIYQASHHGGNSQLFPPPIPFVSPFVDATEALGALGGDITMPGFFPDDEVKLYPFDDSKRLNRSYVSGSHLGDIEAALLVLTGSDSDSFSPDGYKSAAGGFTYDNNPEGTDSLAFGGLKR